jgi:hypothetical protein
MKKNALLIASAALLIFVSACSLKNSVGYVNNSLAWRAGMGDIKAEVSLGVSVKNDYSDIPEIDLPGLYYKTGETGVDTADAWLGIAGYYRLFKNDIFDISAGLKFSNNFKTEYDYTYYYEAYTGSRSYHYDENFAFNFFSENKLSLILPDAEIKCPFSDNMKFTVSAELIYLKWRYNGGKYKSRFTQDVSTYTPYAENFEEKTEGPGAVNDVSFGSDIFRLGTINIGVLYYF